MICYVCSSSQAAPFAFAQLSSQPQELKSRFFAFAPLAFAQLEFSTRPRCRSTKLNRKRESCQETSLPDAQLEKQHAFFSAFDTRLRENQVPETCAEKRQAKERESRSTFSCATFTKLQGQRAAKILQKFRHPNFNLNRHEKHNFLFYRYQRDSTLYLHVMLQGYRRDNIASGGILQQGAG